MVLVLLDTVDEAVLDVQERRKMVFHAKLLTLLVLLDIVPSSTTLALERET
jgi:hypothetical protein